MSTFTFDDTAPLLIEITPEPGVMEVALTQEQIAAKAEAAWQSVMNTVHTASKRFSSLFDNLPDQFNQVELSFGIKISSEMGAIIAKAGLESTFNVKLVWQKKA